MRRPVLLLLALAACLALGLPAAADARSLAVGFGEQRDDIFADARWQQLGLKDVRLVVSWDVLSRSWERADTDRWMAAADASGARVLVSFSRSRSETRKRYLPTPAQYRRHVVRFMERYPNVDAYIPWNEANHCSQPLCKRPRLAAAYFDILDQECACVVLAPSVLDQANMIRWVKSFLRHADGAPEAWALHNYLDANRFRTKGTRALLRTVRGKIWFTETGGLVHRANPRSLPFPDSPAHAAKATKWVFERLVPLSSRIERVYFYHWSEPLREGATWDSGVVTRTGQARPALKVIARAVQRLRVARRLYEHG